MIIITFLFQMLAQIDKFYHGHEEKAASAEIANNKLPGLPHLKTGTDVTSKVQRSIAELSQLMVEMLHKYGT